MLILPLTKPSLLKDATSKLFYEKVERYHAKGKVWSGIKTFCTIQNSYPVISSINKLNNSKAAKSMSTFDFSTLYTKIPHDKLLYVLNKITDFSFKGEARDYITVYNSGTFWSRPKSKIGRSYSLQAIKSYLEFLVNNSPFQVGSTIFLFFYEYKWLKSIKKITMELQENVAIFLGLLMI